MTGIQRLTQDFTDFFDGNPWFGNNFKNIISDITPAEALAEPPNGHSIARLLWHMVKWRIALTERLLGNLAFRADVSDADNWRENETLDAESWEAAKRQYESLQTVIVTELGRRTDGFFDEEFLPGKKFGWLATGVVQHDIYHLGQIAMVKSLVRKHGLWR